LIGLALLAFGISARAVDVSGSCDSQSVQCDLQISYIEVCNDNGFTDFVVPSVSGEVSDWLRVLPEKAEIPAGECFPFEVYTIAPCYEEPGDYTAFVSFNGADTQTITCDIEINQGHFVDIEIQPHEEVVSQCEEANFDIILTNNTIVPNQMQELVNLSIAGLNPEWVDLETNQIIVDKGDPSSIELNVLSACTTDIGKYNFEVKASLFNPNFFTVDDGILTITQGQGIDTDTDETDFGAGTEGDPFIACIETSRTVPVKITNTGKKDDNFNISLEGPEWIKLSQNTLSIEQGEEKEIQLIMEKTDAEQKTYPIKLTFESTIFNFTETQELFVSLEDCFNALLDFPDEQEAICKDEENELVFNVRNDKKYPLDLQVEIEGISGTPDQDVVSLDAFEEKELRVQVDTQNLADEGSAEKTPSAIEIIFDASGSMKQRIDEQRKIDIAKNAVISFTKNIEPLDIGLRVFGHTDGCGQSEQIEPINENGTINIPEKIRQFNAAGLTPLSAALEDSIADFDGKTGNKYVILVSDGKESCGGDIDAAAQKLSDDGIKVYAIGFDIDETGKEQLQKITQKTGGQYFDATNADELFKVFNEISKELDIQLSKPSQKTFTVKLTSETFSIEKDFTITVSDCHNVALFVPEVNVCRNVEENELITITNIGTQDQQIRLNIEPGFVDAETENFSLNAGQTVLVPVKINATDNSNAEELSVTATSDNIDITTTAKINYLSKEACHGFEMIVLTPEFVGRIGEGERRKILLVNLGKTAMDIAIDGDQPWMYFEPENVPLQESEIGFTNFYVTPPFDFSLLNEDTVATITATNNYGIQAQKEARLVVTGPTFGLVPQHIEVKQVDVSAISEDQSDKDIEITFTLENQSERTIEIRSVTIPGYATSAEISQMVLKAGESADVRVLVDVGEKTGKITLPLIISTIDGSILREVEATVPEAQPQEPVEEEPTEEPSGLFSLTSLENVAIILVVLLVIILIGFLIFRTENSDKPKEEKFQATKGEIAGEKKIEVKEKKKFTSKKTVKKTRK